MSGGPFPVRSKAISQRDRSTFGGALADRIEDAQVGDRLRATDQWGRTRLDCFDERFDLQPVQIDATDVVRVHFVECLEVSGGVRRPAGFVVSFDDPQTLCAVPKSAGAGLGSVPAF